MMYPHHGKSKKKTPDTITFKFNNFMIIILRDFKMNLKESLMPFSCMYLAIIKINKLTVT